MIAFEPVETRNQIKAFVELSMSGRVFLNTRLRKGRNADNRG